MLAIEFAATAKNIIGVRILALPRGSAVLTPLLFLRSLSE
jgi:hypothetical protein